MWSILTKEMDAFVLLVDSTDRGSLMDQAGDAAIPQAGQSAVCCGGQ